MLCVCTRCASRTLRCRPAAAMDKDSSMLEVLSHQIHVPVWWTAVCTRLGAKCRVAVVNTPTYSKVTTNGIRDNSGLEVLVWNAHARLSGYHRKLHGVRLSTQHIPKEGHAVLRSLLNPERVNSLFQQHSNVQCCHGCLWSGCNHSSSRDWRCGKGLRAHRRTQVASRVSPRHRCNPSVCRRRLGSICSSAW